MGKEELQRFMRCCRITVTEDTRVTKKLKCAEVLISSETSVANLHCGRD